jgi:predicted GIY-YIG superfamily endonuclease
MIKGVRTTAAIAFAIALAAGLCKTSAMAVTFYPEDTAYRNAPQQTTPIDAFGYVGGILEARFYEPHTTTNDPREEISEAASLYGIDLPMMLSIAKVESDFNPHARTGSYKGLFQLSDYEFAKYGDGSIWDARDNARAAAHMFLVQAERFKWALGHFPDYAERYMVHQQGIEGAIEHYEHPDRVAWQSMCATSEGLLKGEHWCKKCIWGNLLPRWKRLFGSVDKISSGDFVSLWTGRINLLANRYNDVTESVKEAGSANPPPTESVNEAASTNLPLAESLKEATSANPPPSAEAPVRVISMRVHPRMHRTAARSRHAIVATAKGKGKSRGLLALAVSPADSKATRARPHQAAAARRRGTATKPIRPQRQASVIPR